ncbi:MAG: Asp-tRNA(Asn)/Glu-tRNA(Gln) amidotransferase subunit GatA, partial [Ruthenibacterium sp.]
MMNLYQKSATELSALLRKKEISAVEIATDTLARIAAIEPQIDAFLSVNHDGMLEKANDVDAKIAKNETIGVLAGIPVAI